MCSGTQVIRVYSQVYQDWRNSFESYRCLSFFWGRLWLTFCTIRGDQISWQWMYFSATHDTQVPCCFLWIEWFWKGSLSWIFVLIVIILYLLMAAHLIWWWMVTWAECSLCSTLLVMTMSSCLVDGMTLFRYGNNYYQNLSRLKRFSESVEIHCLIQEKCDLERMNCVLKF